MTNSVSPNPSTSEIATKLAKLRNEMEKNGLAGVRFKGSDWFAWVTGGANSVVFFPSETGIAEVFVSLKNAYVLTDRIEATRLIDEELPRDFEVFESPWQQKSVAYDEFIDRALAGETSKIVACDRPTRAEVALPPGIVVLRLTFSPEEIERYKVLGRDAAEAMRDALLRAKPDWTEFDLAGEGAKEQWKRGIEPVLALVCGENRLLTRRHPMPTRSKLGGRAMMVFCARRHGLYANITRFVYFREPTSTELNLHEDLMMIEQAVLDATIPGATLDSCFKAVADAYAALGYEEELQNHHQGGSCGYGAREKFAAIKNPASVHDTIRERSAVAWNPSLPGAKMEDTFIVESGGLLNVTLIDSCPTKLVGGRKRPWPYMLN